MEKLLSIIIPAFNAERFISKQLEELVNQLEGIESNCEIIVVDDGSKDKTREIVEIYTNKYSFIKLISQLNKGECGARNTGIKHAIGEYLYFLDADDFLEKDSIKFFISRIRSSKDEIDLFCYSYKSIDYDTNRLLTDYQLKQVNKSIFTKEQFLVAYYGKKIYVHVCSSVVKRDCILKNNVFFTEGVRIGGDILFQLQLFNSIKKVYCEDRHCFIYRIRNDSIMQGYKVYQPTQYLTLELFKSVLYKNNFSNMSEYINFFMAVHYVYNLKLYLKSNTVDFDINEAFIDDSKLLRKRMKSKNIKLLIICKLLSCFSIRLLLKIRHKYTNEEK